MFELSQLEVRRGLERLFGAGIDALPAVYAFEVYHGLTMPPVNFLPQRPRSTQSLFLYFSEAGSSLRYVSRE